VSDNLESDVMGTIRRSPFSNPNIKKVNMYIISKNKDYYDGVVGTTGVDKTIVYEREPVIEEDPHKFIEPFTARKSWSRRDRTPFNTFQSSYPIKRSSIYEASSGFIVGFCGKLYIGWKFYREVTNEHYNTDMETFITYDLEFIKKEVVNRSWEGNLINDIDYILGYNPMEIFRKLKTPIFIYDSDYDRKFIKRYRRNDVLITNPTLKDYEFYKVMDSYTAFQEIQMFIGGVLGIGEKEIVEVEDKYKIAQHGFDNNSFRRSKANGKKRPQSDR